MKRWLLGMSIVVLMMVCVSGAMAREMTAETGYVDGKTADRVHLREKPSTGAKSLGLYFTGTEVLCDTSSSDGEWIWVNVGAEAGYMKAEYLRFGRDAQGLIPAHPMGMVSVGKADGWVNLRSEPSLQGEIVGRLKHRESAIILGETAGGWYYIDFGNGYAYVQAKYMMQGSGAAAPSATAVPTASGATAAPMAPAATAVPTALKAYGAILQNQAPFISAYDNKTVTLDAHLESLGDGFAVSGFAVLDMDQDGTPEVVLAESRYGNDMLFEVLDYQNGTVYGYDFGYRALLGLKEDGSFSFSSGAAENGFGVVQFQKNTCSVMEQAHSVLGADMSVSYFVGGSLTTEAAFQQAVQKQEAKADASWYLFDQESVQGLLLR